jgi:hypothetical protein
MRRTLSSVLAATLLVALMALVGTAPAFAGGALETLDITGFVPSPIAGQVVAKVIGFRWDSRCMPVQYRVNNFAATVPNPLGAPFLSLADATAAFQRSFDRWNNIPTSWVKSQVVGNLTNAGVRGFDMKNELTFNTAAGFTAIASSPSIALLDDETLVPGDDIDGDGDSDVFASLTTCGDADSDGDIDFPPGFYKAGTIVDNDVQFNTKASNGFRFTVLDSQADVVVRSVDLESVATHEFGHSIGLSHVLNNQKSGTDGNGATMFPFVDTGDPAAELAQRSLDSDDIAWASYFYPEGTASSGPAALQPGDQRFDRVYGLIEGSVTHGVQNAPLAGASVTAIDKKTGEVFTSAFSGTTQLSFNPLTGGIFLVSQAFNIVDGNFVMPVKKGEYKVAVEPVDGAPAGVGNISFTCQIGGAFGQQAFNAEYWNGEHEGSIEKASGDAETIEIEPDEDHHGHGHHSDHGDCDEETADLITNNDITIANFGTRDFIGFTGQPAGSYYAVRIPASQISAILPGQKISIHAAQYDNALADASVVPLWAEATLTTGTVSGTSASLNFAKPLARTTGFVGADNNLASLFFKSAKQIGDKVRKGIDRGDISNLFIVLRLPTATPFPGVSALPPLIGLDGGVAVNDVPINGFSYVSNDGATWTQVGNFNFRFSLVVSALPTGDDDDD